MTVNPLGTADAPFVWGRLYNESLIVNIESLVYPNPREWTSTFDDKVDSDRHRGSLIIFRNEDHPL